MGSNHFKYFAVTMLFLPACIQTKSGLGTRSTSSQAVVKDSSLSANSHQQSEKTVNATFSPSAGFVMRIPQQVNVVYKFFPVASTVDASDFLVSGTCPGVAIQHIETKERTSVLHLQGTDKCRHEDTLIVRVNFSGIQDQAGRLGEGQGVLTLVQDNVKPSVVLKERARVDATASMAVTAHFDRDIDLDSVSAEDIHLSGTCAQASLGQIHKETHEVIIHVDNTQGCLAGETVLVSIHMPGVSDQAGNTGHGAVTHSLLHKSINQLVASNR